MRLCFDGFMSYGGRESASGLKFIKQALHFTSGMSVFCALSGAEAFFQPSDGLVGAA